MIEIILACLNYPGSWHDSTILGTETDTIIQNLLGDCALCVDAGFPRTGDFECLLVGPYTEKSARLLNPVHRDFLLGLSACYVS